MSPSPRDKECRRLKCYHPILQIRFLTHLVACASLGRAFECRFPVSCRGKHTPPQTKYISCQWSDRHANSFPFSRPILYLIHHKTILPCHILFYLVLFCFILMLHHTFVVCWHQLDTLRASNRVHSVYKKMFRVQSCLCTGNRWI